MSSPSRTFAVARSPEGPLSGLRLAAPCGRLVGPEDPSCCLVWSHGFRFPQRRSEDQGCFQWSRQPLAGRSLDPKTSVAPTRAAGFVTPVARSEDLAPRAPRAADLVSKVGSVRRLCLLPVERCRPRPVTVPVRRPARLPSRADTLGWAEAQLRSRLWHKVEHVHPGALRGRAVGSAPNIRRTSGNGPSLALQSRLQRLGFAPRSPPPAPPKWFRSRLAASLELLEPPSASSTSDSRSALPRSTRSSRSLSALAQRRRFHTDFQIRVTRRVAPEPCTQTRRSGR